MQSYHIQVYRVRQLGLLPDLIRESTRLMFKPKAYYNHVIAKHGSYYYELDCGVDGVHEFHEDQLPKDWELSFCFDFETPLHPKLAKIKYSQWANISWFLWNIPLLKNIFRKLILPRFHTNCCGYIAHLAEDTQYCYLHPQDF
ncbi:MAG: hypothetical protein KC646_10555 [Candidatus Cloacimonetes bacterium]|nr:hypothetical protein [Candidatus Cloacimonadota bacterium]